MHRFDLLVFDLDGTLVDSSPCHSRAYRDLWREVGIEEIPYPLIAGRKTRDVVAELTAELGPTEAQIRKWVYFKQGKARQYLATETIMFGDSASCLEALARHQVRLALGTGASRDSTYVILKSGNIFDFFSIIITAEDVRDGKPSPEVYLKVMAQAMVSPDRTLIIEDSPAGLEAAIISRAYVASVRTGRRVDDSRFVGSFSDLYELLRGIGFSVQ